MALMVINVEPLVFSHTSMLELKSFYVIAEEISCEEGSLNLLKERMLLHDARCQSAEGGDQTLLV